MIDSDSLFEHDDAQLTILGVRFDNQRQYRIALSSIANTVWEGWTPNKQDAIDVKQTLLGHKPSIQTLINREKRHHS